jgi:hypothetical protein
VKLQIGPVSLADCSMRHQAKSAFVCSAEYLKYYVWHLWMTLCVTSGSGEAADSKGGHDRKFNAESPGKDSSLIPDPPRSLNRWLIFGAWVLISLLLFAKPVYGLFQLANHDETASHILLIPFITAWLLYTERKQLQPETVFSIWPAMLFLMPSLLILLISLNCQAWWSPASYLL